ncbi:FIG085779: Lipoprotein [plant metagenome]|uniref:FIG085779: Lipoprotein n=1 Tax=plant metagenome TaxID=1297885 RepID=A0A484SXR8_9ZZZZ
MTTLSLLLARVPRISLIACALALLAGCASAVPTPVAPVSFTVPRMLHVQRAHPALPDGDAFLVVQAEAGHTRWSLFTVLGAPLARQTLEDGHWRNDGFAPPNASATRLFAALVFAWTPEADLAERYRQDRYTVDTGRRTLSQKNGKPLIVADSKEQLSVELPDGSTWVLRPLEQVQ